MTHEQWMAKVCTCASELDSLEVDKGAPTDDAQAALRDGGCGRQRAVVHAAMRFRRGEPVEQPSSTRTNDRERAAARVTQLEALLVAARARHDELFWSSEAPAP